jgi:hypothetical protein
MLSAQREIAPEGFSSGIIHVAFLVSDIGVKKKNRKAESGRPKA